MAANKFGIAYQDMVRKMRRDDAKWSAPEQTIEREDGTEHVWTRPSGGTLHWLTPKPDAPCARWGDQYWEVEHVA